VSRIAADPQASEQLPHTTPRRAMHASPTTARNSQACAAASWRSAPLPQALAQSAQNVHSPREKSISGKPPDPGTMRPALQAVTHSPQRLQAAVKSGSEWVQGGRIGSLRPRRSPLRNCLRETAMANLSPPKKVRQS
jgi:hypothetical protein